tara:strand:- start:90 stop:272 length:183 start_codon:yes stop_codon:yes gene_type:complete
MELIILVLGVGLIVGLIIRKREDNTMQTLSKGCGFIVVICIISILIYVYTLYYMAEVPNP